MAKRTPDQIIEYAYEQFLERASAELAPEQIVDIALEFEERGAVESATPNADWKKQVGADCDLKAWLEVQVGLLNAKDQFDEIYAKVLVPLDPKDQRLFWRWFPLGA